MDLPYLDQSAGKARVMNEALISEFARGEAHNAVNGEATVGSPLRPVQWSELTARLAAMRDLRHSLSATSRVAGANFSSLAMAEVHSLSAFTNLTGPREESQRDSAEVNAATPDINSKALADRKGPAPNSSIESNCVTPGDREMK